jgi:hypothetical protein
MEDLFGRMLDALRELELAQDTIVAFASAPGPRRGDAPI